MSKYRIKPNKIVRIASRLYGVFNANETRVVLIDKDRMWIPTETYPIWGSKLGVVGTVGRIVNGGSSIEVMWDNGAKNVFNIKYLEQYNTKKHGDPKNKVKPGPNISFRMRKKYGEIKI